MHLTCHPSAHITGITSPSGQAVVNTNVVPRDIIGVNVEYSSPASSGTLRLWPNPGMHGRSTVTISILDAVTGHMTGSSFVVDVKGTSRGSTEYSGLSTDQKSPSGDCDREWTEWTVCTLTCGGGTQTREQVSDYPSHWQACTHLHLAYASATRSNKDFRRMFYCRYSKQSLLEEPMLALHRPQLPVAATLKNARRKVCKADRQSPTA